MKRIIPLAVLTFLLFSVACLGEGAKKAEMVLDTKIADATGSLDATEITAAQFMETYKSADDFVLIDVRSDREYDSGHIPGAVHIPYTELGERMGGLGLSKDQKIVLYCEAGVRSKRGANALLDAGYTNVLDVTDGMAAWRNIGGEVIIPVIEDEQVPETTPPVEEVEVPVTTTLPPVVTEAPAWESTPPPETTPPTHERYLEVEPALTIEDFEGTKTLDLKMWTVVKIGDAFIYLIGDMDGCVGIFWWTFKVYGDSPEGGIWEGETTFMNEEVHSGQDISPQIHFKSDALDDYTIVVTKWSEVEGLTVEISS